MPGFARRPITIFVCCLFAAIPVSVAAADSDASSESAVKLRPERKFNVLGKTGTSASAANIGINNPVVLKKNDSYPTFVIADQIEGRANEEAVATGRVELRKIDTQMFADKITYWPLEDEVEAIGKVRMLQDGLELDTSYLRMRMTEQIGFSGELDYRMQKFVESKFYQAVGVVPVAATSNTSVSSAPMMANVANSYGLPTAQPGRRATEGNGHAERVDFEGENQIRLRDATYSTCKPDDTAWYLKGSQVHLDYDEDVGEARHASVWFLGVPIFYSPVASFPLNQQRKSGFLHASFGTTTNTGLDYTIPYYWNIAPNYDVTFNPRYMSKRGIQLGANINYLDYNYSGRTRLEYMPDDKIAGRDRYGYNIQHQHNFGRGVSGLINWNGVSDDAYWEDLSSKLLETSQVQIPQQLQLAYAPSPWLQTTMMVQRYQTLQTDAANPVERPYFLEPQLNILGFRPNLMKTDLAVIGQFTRFANPEKIQADRAVLYPQISLPIVHPAFQITPKIGLHMTQYSLSDVENFAMNGMSAAPPDSISRTLPVLSLDSTVIFERESKFLDLGYIQTLEPRLYYVNISYKDQQQIPVFDSGLTDFNFAQIFSENRYSGFDRINDANQLTAAVTTRFLDADTGVERFKAMVGQRYYFSDQRVTLPGETQRNTNLSNLIAAFNGLVLPKTYADAAIEYDYDLQEVDRFSVGARFQPDFGKVISASYRYTRDPLSLVPQVDQIDIAAQWPLSARWYAVGRYNYSLRDSQPLEAIAGLEYNAGCWALRTVVQRLSAVSSTIEPNASFFLQLELNDLGSIGSNPISLLRRTIPGYGKINELPSSGSLLTTP
ncbi:MAG: LPS-assembly protein LptD [Rhodocyclaceae bacterium]|nr:LPS-assembly protein LptD [Rhodocyclaceae bacterium]